MRRVLFLGGPWHEYYHEVPDDLPHSYVVTVVVSSEVSWRDEPLALTTQFTQEQTIYSLERTPNGRYVYVAPGWRDRMGFEER